MSIKQCCSLCCTACCEYQLLQNEAGDSNEIYEITVKYFDPMLLTDEEGNPNYDQEIKVLCQDCWLHINDFNEFQQNVITTRNTLEKSNMIKQLETDIKQENVQDDKTFWGDEEETDKSDDDDHSFEDVYVNNYEDECDNLAADNISINSNEDNDDDDDEKPLITLTKIASDKSKNSENKVIDEENQLEKPKSRRGRKSKNCISKDLKADDNDDDLTNEKSPSKRKKLKLVDDTKKESSNNIEKGLESDSFIAEWKPELECDICGETSTNFQQLRQHFKEQHKTRGYIKCCERKFHRRYVLVDHIRLHLNPEMHKCDICGKPSSSQYNLKLHKKIMHESTEQFECEVCHKMFNQKPTLERHRLIHVTGSKDFVCQECGKAYVLEVQLKSHIKTVHNVDRVCDQCGKTIHGVAALKKHLMEHAGIKRPKFPCDKCGAELNSRNSLRRHMAAFHHDGTTIYVCGICGKVASSENALLTHKKHVHIEERKHKCTYCDKAFKRPKVLREHIATHTGQDLYQCPHCPQTFKVSANMHHHRKKVHPIEWEEGRKNRLQLPKVNINQVKNQVVI
ncbi:transcription factor grauzone-like [Calliphora vicina]|uniref:transcription factor grauzone-like n=1 Tax=Calliphora vicina TaxID=7373 RepID=UPI00325B7158